MEETINPAIVIPVVMICFALAIWFTYKFAKQEVEHKMYDVRQDLKTSSEHLEKYRKLYYQSDAEVNKLKAQLIRVTNAKATMNNRLVLIRKSLNSQPVSEIVDYIKGLTDGFEQAEVLQSPKPTERKVGAHSLYIDGNGDAKIRTQKL
jgi:hypothetical protein